MILLQAVECSLQSGASLSLFLFRCAASYVGAEGFYITWGKHKRVSDFGKLLEHLKVEGSDTFQKIRGLRRALRSDRIGAVAWLCHLLWEVC